MSKALSDILKGVCGSSVDKGSVDLISKILSREIVPDKSDISNYQNQFFSRLDIGTIQLKDIGMGNSIRPGDGVLITAWLQKNVDNDPELHDYVVLALKEKFESYSHMIEPYLRFCAPIGYDIASKYLLKTEKADNLYSLLNQMSLNSDRFISKADWTDILNAVNKANKRITSEDIVFLSPVDAGVLGEHRELTTDEKVKYGLGDKDSKMDADFRKDEHDLVSLKELASAMSGNQIDDLSPFAGAFLKYIPELNEAGIRSVAFEVVDNVLNSITLSRFNGKTAVPFGPTESAIALAQCFPNLKAVKDFKLNTKYYVSVSGFVCAPEQMKHFGYSEMIPKLNKVVPAGETFLIQTIGDLQYGGVQHPTSIRLYFYPLKPKDLHPIYQTMSVIYGLSDNMHHSCANDPNSLFYTNEFKEKFANDCSSNMFNDQPAARYVYHDIQKINEFIPPGAAYSKDPEYKKIFGVLGKEMSDAFYGENLCTSRKYLEVAKNVAGFPHAEAKIVDDLQCLDFPRCLPSGFVFYNYVQGIKGGLISKYIATTIRKTYCDFGYGRGSWSLTKENMEDTADLRQALNETNGGKDILVAMKEFWAKVEFRKKKAG